MVARIHTGISRLSGNRPIRYFGSRSMPSRRKTNTVSQNRLLTCSFSNERWGIDRKPPERPPFEKPRSLRAPRQDRGMSRTRHTDKEKARILREFEYHDGSAAAFCRQRGVSYQTLMNWRGHASANLPNPEQPPAFLEFQLESAPHRPARRTRTRWRNHPAHPSCPSNAAEDRRGNKMDAHGGRGRSGCCVPPRCLSKSCPARPPAGPGNPPGVRSWDRGLLRHISMPEPSRASPRLPSFPTGLVASDPTVMRRICVT